MCSQLLQVTYIQAFEFREKGIDVINQLEGLSG